jgi:hypothetical protein
VESHPPSQSSVRATALPVIRGSRWFGPDAGPFVLRIEVPVTAGQMAAAIYDAAQPDEIESDEELCGTVAVTLLIASLPALEARARRLRSDEELGTLESPVFLARCRERVAQLLLA